MLAKYTSVEMFLGIQMTNRGTIIKIRNANGKRDRLKRKAIKSNTLGAGNYYKQCGNRVAILVSMSK